MQYKNESKKDKLMIEATAWTFVVGLAYVFVALFL